jgi:hypothetical protein
MTPPKPSTHVRCKLCGYVFPGGWLRVFNEPNGALLLHHLSWDHPDQVGPYLERMRTEDIGTVAMEAFERVEHASHRGDIPCT